MAKDSSFDIVSKVDPQEVRNAVDQATREIASRFDFKGSRCSVEFDGKTIKVAADDEPKMEQLMDVLESKLFKRGVSAKGLEWGKLEAAGHMTVRKSASLKAGVPQPDAKKIVQMVKDAKIKAQVANLGDHLRVSAKARDDLQEVITLLKKSAKDITVDLQFTNYQ
jgi:hypothetical protein